MENKKKTSSLLDKADTIKRGFLNEKATITKDLNCFKDKEGVFAKEDNKGFYHNLLDFFDKESDNVLAFQALGYAIVEFISRHFVTPMKRYIARETRKYNYANRHKFNYNVASASSVSLSSNKSNWMSRGIRNSFNSVSSSKAGIMSKVFAHKVASVPSRIKLFRFKRR